jgi:CheY-like chemotaxis protein
MDRQEALYMARYDKPDLILLDLMMPEMGGYEFMRAHTRDRELGLDSPGVAWYNETGLIKPVSLPPVGRVRWVPREP